MSDKQTLHDMHIHPSFSNTELTDVQKQAVQSALNDLEKETGIRFLGVFNTKQIKEMEK